MFINTLFVVGLDLNRDLNLANEDKKACMKTLVPGVTDLLEVIFEGCISH